MPDYLGDDMRKVKKGEKDKDDGIGLGALSETDVQVLQKYIRGPYGDELKTLQAEIEELLKNVNELSGVKESDTGLAPPALWNLAADSKPENPPFLDIAHVGKIWKHGDQDRYMIRLRRYARLVVGLSPNLSPMDVEEGMRVGVDATLSGKYMIHLPLPKRIASDVAAMVVEEKPDLTYADIGGCKEQIEKIREILEKPLTNPEAFVKLGIEPPKGIMFYGPPGTGKTLCARAVAARTDATFIRINGTELVQKYVGEGGHLVREIFEVARSRRACIIFFDEIDAIGGSRFYDSSGSGDSEIQRTMLELICQLDGFDNRGPIKVIMATNRPDTLDPALVRPGRIDRKLEFTLPDVKGREHIFKIHTQKMSVQRGIRYDLLARLCPNCTGAEIRSVCTEAGMYAIRARRKITTEKDFLNAIEKVVRGYMKFSATPRYMTHN